MMMIIMPRKSMKTKIADCSWTKMTESLKMTGISFNWCLKRPDPDLRSVER